MDLLDAQPEFTKSFWDYLDLLVNDARIEQGRALLAQVPRDLRRRRARLRRRPLHHRRDLGRGDRITARTVGDRPVIRSTATLACIGRRQNYFREEFLVGAGNPRSTATCRPDRLVGSWAGAFGPTQFMPTAFKRYAVDFDRDGRRDVVDSVPDIIASTANNLKKDGWVSGQTWGYEVVVPATFNFLLADHARTMTIRDWERLGIARPGGKPFPRPDERAFLLVPAGVQGPGFLMLTNFRVIMSYNPAEAYALAIGHLADRLRGGGPFAQPGRATSGCCRAASGWKCSNCWRRRGYDVGEPDGHLGAKTRAAIRDFQARIGRFPTALPRPTSSTSCAPLKLISRPPSS